MRLLLLLAPLLLACSTKEPPRATSVDTEAHAACHLASGRYVTHWERRLPSPRSGKSVASGRCGYVADQWIDMDDTTPDDCVVNLRRDDSCLATGTVVCGEVTSEVACQWDKAANEASCTWRTTTSYCDETYDVTYRRPLWADFLSYSH